MSYLLQSMEEKFELNVDDRLRQIKAEQLQTV